jgi:fatty-acyl-CoA synthase
VAHPTWVEAVVAVVVPKAGTTLSQAQVLAHCAAHLASFKTPKAVLIVDSLPKNPSGKLLKRELRRLYAGLFDQAGQGGQGGGSAAAAP